MYGIVKSPEIVTRYAFAHLCNARKITVAIEVGTDQGVFAKEFMTRFKGHHLFCIDPYTAYEWGAEDRLPDMLMAVHNLAPYAGVVRIVRDFSPGVIDSMPNWILDLAGFVYIDGAHDYESVIADIRAWWNATSSNCIIAGHDFDDTHPGVQQAVREFASEKNRIVRLVDRHLPSWYMYKSEPRLLDLTHLE